MFVNYVLIKGLTRNITRRIEMEDDSDEKRGRNKHHKSILTFFNNQFSCFFRIQPCQCFTNVQISTEKRYFNSELLSIV